MGVTPEITPDAIEVHARRCRFSPGANLAVAVENKSSVHGPSSMAAKAIPVHVHLPR